MYLGEWIVGHPWTVLGYWAVGCIVFGFSKGFAQAFFAARFGEDRS